MIYIIIDKTVFIKKNLDYMLTLENTILKPPFHILCPGFPPVAHKSYPTNSHKTYNGSRDRGDC